MSSKQEYLTDVRLIIEETQKGKKWHVKDGAVIGRDDACDVVLNHGSVSRIHAELYFKEGSFYLKDMNSKNGTYVDGKRITSSSLNDGSLIQVGDVQLRAIIKKQEDGDTVGVNGGLIKYIRDRLIVTVDISSADETTIRSKIQEILHDDGIKCGSGELENILKEIVGLGPIQDLIDDETVSEIMVNGPNDIYVERGGRIEKTNIQFFEEDDVLRIIERIVSPLGRRIDESNPYVDARLPDGSRVNAIIPPVSLSGPVLTIRKFSRKRLTGQDLIKAGTLSESMLTFLRLSVVHKKNIIVSGGTGTGKTTMLNVLSGFIPEGERIITVEDAAELQLDKDHVVRLESRPAGFDGGGEVTIRDLVKNSLRMRPDRIIVGECRGGEALDMLQAMNTGHSGSMTTVHANSPRDAISRLVTLVLMAGYDLPMSAIVQWIASAVDLIVQIERFRDGSRKVTSISEITGVEGMTVVLKDIFLYDRHHGGSFISTGFVPDFIQKLIDEGHEIDLEVFHYQGELKW